MSNHVPTNAASGAVRGGILGGLGGALLTLAGTAAIGALIVTGIGAAGAAAAYAIGWTSAATVGAATLAALPVSAIIGAGIGTLGGLPFAVGGAWLGAAGGSLLGAAGGVERGQNQNVQEQARSAYINAYAQTRAGIDQMAMQAAYAPPVMQMQAPEQLVAANENTPKLQIHADSAEHHGKTQHAAAHAVTV